MRVILGVFISITMSLIVCTAVKSQETLPEIENYPLDNGLNLSKQDELRIDYSDWDMVLNKTVFDRHFSTRRYARNTKPFGTLVSRRNPKPTRLEANRVFFHILKDDAKEYIRRIKQSLEEIPVSVPLEEFSRNEQLAYWLNLRNVTVYEAIMDKYPIRKMKSFIEELNDDKRINISGKNMSIQDVEDHVMRTWKNPLVIYGFYLGNIGSPNLMNRAFTADTVWNQLEKNAQEFTYSLRGIQFDGRSAKISRFYERVASAFPNFKKDVMDHFIIISQSYGGTFHAKATIMASRLASSASMEATIDDWYIADLLNGSLGLETASTVRSTIFGLKGIPGEYVDTAIYPLQVQEIIRDTYLRVKQYNPTVIVEDIDDAKKSTAKK